MIELNEGRIDNIKEEVSKKTFSNNTDYEEGIKLWKDFVSAPLGESQECLLNTMDGFDELCDSFFTKKKWDMTVRNKKDVENYFSTLLYAVNEVRWKQLNAEEKKNLRVLYTELGLEKDDTEWTGTELSDEEAKKWKADRKEAYKFIYKLYYAVSNEKVTKDNFDTGRYHDMIDCLFSVYIDLAARYQNEIQKAYARVDIKVNWFDYCDEILKDRRRKKAFDEYVMVNWKEAAREPVSTKDFPENTAVITLCGGAGVGKTSALQYLQYDICQRYVNGERGMKIPVLIHLKEIKDSGVEKNVQQLICEELKIDMPVLNEVLKNADIKLYFDGLNEVPEEDKVQERVKKQINDIIDRYAIPMIVTDRTGETGIKPENTGAICKKYKLVNLDEKQVREYFARKTESDPEAMNRIEKELNESLAWVLTEPVTPHQLEVIVKLAKAGDEFGERDILMQKYLKELFEREIRQRERREVFELRAWLREISKMMSNSGRKDISRSNAIELLKGRDDIPFLLWAKELMIIYSDGDKVRFVSDEYCNYFLNYVTEEGTDNLKEIV